MNYKVQMLKEEYTDKKWKGKNIIKIKWKKLSYFIKGII